MCIPIERFTISIRVSISTGGRNLERQLWSFVLLPVYSWDHQTWPPHLDVFIFYLGKLELSDKASYEDLQLDDTDKDDVSEDLRDGPANRRATVTYANLHPIQLRAPAENVRLWSVC